jgi:hypothetical protein
MVEFDGNMPRGAMYRATEVVQQSVRAPLSVEQLSASLCKGRQRVDGSFAANVVDAVNGVF